MLNDIVGREIGGTFTCLLGGKSTGKSFVLYDMEKYNLNKMFIVDLRKKSNILQGLLDVLQERKDPEIIKRITMFIAETLSMTIDAATEKFGIKTNLYEFLKFFYQETEKGSTLEKLISHLLDKIPDVITIVIDEANIAFTLSGDKDEKKIVETKEALALFTRLTKQNQRINVILVSSEHSFPFRLSEDLDFNIDNMSTFIFAGEVPPKDMYSLLTTQWGVKHNLAMALIGHYGGHIYDVYNALLELKLVKSSFVATSPAMIQNVNTCLECKEVDEKRMIDTLTKLAIDGFVPLKNRNDPVAKIISKYDVGGVVQKKLNPIGLPNDLWRVHSSFGIIPSKQSMRLVIAMELQNLNLKEKN